MTQALKWRMIHYNQLHSNTHCKPCFHPTDANTIFASAGYSGMKVSHDRGEHWDVVAGITAADAQRITIDPGFPALMLTGSTEGVWRSVDAGITWAKTTGTSGEVLALHVDQSSPSDHRVCFAATSAGIYRSDDAGMNWAEKTKGLPSKKIVCFSGGSNAKDKLCMIYCAVPSKDEGGKFGGVCSVRRIKARRGNRR